MKGRITVPIKNYTTKIGVGQSLGEIQDALARNGASKIMVDYSDSIPISLTFAIQTENGLQGFQLPANLAGVARTFERQKVKADRNQVMQTAWRNIRDWVMAQMAFIESGNVETAEVFLPYLTDGRGQTLYQLYQKGRLELPSGTEDGK
jgi:hypothetical protein